MREVFDAIAQTDSRDLAQATFAEIAAHPTII
jgi:hypothetical protein